MCPTEETWDQEVCFDSESDSSFDDGHCSAKVRCILGANRHGYRQNVWVDDKSFGSPSDADRSPGSTLATSSASTGVPEERTLCNEILVPGIRKHRPHKKKRNQFRRFVDDLKRQMRDEGAVFQLETLNMPETVFRHEKAPQKVMQILGAYREELRLAHALQQADS